jgi:RNA polymerase sigma-70 factor (ECF subfamily)
MSHDTTAELGALLERLRAGDAAARDLLIARASGRLRRLSRRLLGDFGRLRRYEDTDDVLQSAVLRLLRALRDAPPDSVPHFFRLAAVQIRRELLDLARRYRAQDRPTPDGADRGTTTFEPGRLARWTEFHTAAGRLPEEERAVFDLLWYQGLPQAEAAALLGVSVPTVKRRWLAARLKLRDLLRDGEALG